jgi:AAA domain
MQSTTRHGLNLLVHGPAKHGKTWFANTTPAPRVIIDAEGGTEWLDSRLTYWDPVSQEPPAADGTWETAIAYTDSWDAIAAAYRWLKSGRHPFNSAVLDSLTETQRMCISKLAGINPMQIQDWGTVLRQMLELCRNLRDLTKLPGHPLSAVVITAQTARVNDKWSPDVQGQLARNLPYLFDVCGYLHEIPLESGGSVRRLFLSPISGYETGQRLGGRLPAYVDDPSVASMLETLRAYTPPVPAVAAPTVESPPEVVTAH